MLLLSVTDSVFCRSEDERASFKAWRQWRHVHFTMPSWEELRGRLLRLRQAPATNPHRSSVGGGTTWPEGPCYRACNDPSSSLPAQAVASPCLWDQTFLLGGPNAQAPCGTGTHVTCQPWSWLSVFLPAHLELTALRRQGPGTGQLGAPHCVLCTFITTFTQGDLR